MPKPNKRRKPEARLDRVADLLTQCLPHRVVEERLAAEWKCSRRHIRNYITQVYKQWTARAEEQRPHVRAELEQAFRAFFAEHRSSEPRAAIVALDRLGKMHGVYAPDRVEHAGAVGVARVDVADPDAVRARIREILAKHPDLLPTKPRRGDT